LPDVSLRENGVVTARNNRVTIHDRARLMAIAGEDDGDDVIDDVPMNRNRGRYPASGPGRSSIAFRA
jgi:hypothetical protein